jgi:hypothetical protein
MSTSVTGQSSKAAAEVSVRRAFVEAIVISNPSMETTAVFSRGVAAGKYENTKAGKQLCSQDLRRLRAAGLEHTGKRKVRSADETVQMVKAVEDILYRYHPQTARQIYYQMTVRKLIEKTENGYRQVIDLTINMRKSGRIPYEFIVDNTRSVDKPLTFNKVDEVLTTIVGAYRKALWNGRPSRVQVWLEKDALASVIGPLTAQYDVPLFVARGYSSLSFLHNDAKPIVEDWAAAGLPITVLHLGDFDPSGRDAARKIDEQLREFCPDAVLNFVELAVTTEQIDQWDLPSRPNKVNDPRTKKFEGRHHRQSTELDAIPAQHLRKIVEDALRQHMPDDIYEGLKLREAAERDHIERLVGLAPNWIDMMHDYRGDRPDCDPDDLLPPPNSPAPSTPPVLPFDDFNIMGA